MTDRKPLPGVPDPDHPGWNTLASFSAEQTARFMGGGALGKPAYADPRLEAGIARQGRALHAALYDKIVPALVEATAVDSATTSKRLAQMANMAKNGDAKSGQLLGAMIGQLLTQGLNGGGDA